MEQSACGRILLCSHVGKSLCTSCLKYQCCNRQTQRLNGRARLQDANEIHPNNTMLANAGTQRCYLDGHL